MESHIVPPEDCAPHIHSEDCPCKPIFNRNNNAFFHRRFDCMPDKDILFIKDIKSLENPRKKNES